MITFTVYGVAAPKGSARAYTYRRKDGGGFGARVDNDNPRTKGWQQLVAEAASRELAGRGVLFQGPVRLEVQFYLPRPKSLPKRVLDHCKKPDLDKLVRAVKDALSKVVWRDDAQVIAIAASKFYAAADVSPRAIVSVVPLDQPEGAKP